MFLAYVRNVLTKKLRGIRWNIPTVGNEICALYLKVDKISDFFLESGGGGSQ